MTEDLIYVARNFAHAIDNVIEFYKRPISFLDDGWDLGLEGDSQTLEQEWKEHLSKALLDRNIEILNDGEILTKRDYYITSSIFYVNLYDIIMLLPDKRLVKEILENNEV
jgi:hypothetical protein